MPKLWNKVSEKLRQALPEGSREEILSEVQGFVTRGGALAIRSSNSLALLGLEQDYGRLVETYARSFGFSGEVTYELSAEADVEIDEDEVFVAPTSQLSLFEVPSSPIQTYSSEVREDQAALRIESFDDAKLRMAGLEPTTFDRYPASDAGSFRAPLVPQRVDLEALRQAAADAGLQEQNTLASWVHGEENVFTFGAARAVVMGDREFSNMLFIQGGAGLGKTHLLQAVGLEALRRQPTLRVRYMRAETFLNEFVEAIKARDTSSFHRKVRREVDLLLLDDIDFLAGKEGCQEALLHALNDLLQAEKFVVMTSSISRDDLGHFDARLLSRLGSALTARIDVPTVESRLAILQQVAQQRKIHVPEEVLEYVAENVRCNTGEMLGHFARILSYVRFTGKDLTLELARQQLEQSYKQEQVKVSMDSIVDATVDFYGLERQAIVGRGRTKRVVTPRKVAMYLGRSLTEMSFPELGHFFDKRDHSTIIDACKSIAEELNENRELRQVIKTIERRLGVH